MKNIVQLRNKSDAQLNDQLREIEISLHRLRPFNKGQGATPKEVSKGPNQPPNTMLYSKLKKDKGGF